MTLRFAKEHDRLHTIAGAKNHEAGNYKLFHSNGSGGIVELSAGAAGEVLTAMGASAAPEFIRNLSSGYDNTIINGDFEFWQRGLTLDPLAHGDYGPDRFSMGIVSDGTLKVARLTTSYPTLAQSDHLSRFSCEVSVASVDASIAAAQWVALRYKVEGFDLNPLRGVTAVLSFWVYSNKTGTYCVAFVSGDWDSSYVTEYTINTANTWEKKSVTVTFDDTIGTWNRGRYLGCDIHFTLAAGTDRQVAKDTWVADHQIATSNILTSFMASTSNLIRFSQIKLEPGESATPFRNRQYSEEFIRCQRYYRQSYILGIYPGGTVTQGRVETVAFSIGYAPGVPVWAPAMIDVPTVVLYNPDGTTGEVKTDSDSNVAATAGWASDNGFVFVRSTSDEFVAGEWIEFQYTADAEL